VIEIFVNNDHGTNDDIEVLQLPRSGRQVLFLKSMTTNSLACENKSIAFIEISQDLNKKI
jgi:hypothetical protein